MRVDAGNGYLLNFATMTQRGHYPSDPDKRNHVEPPTNNRAIWAALINVQHRFNLALVA